MARQLSSEDQARALRAERGRQSQRAFFGSIALGVVNLGRLALQLLVMPVLARILGPESFGVVSLAMPFVLFANMLSDAGMSTALVRMPAPSLEVESTVFWLSIAIGAALALLVALGAPEAAALLRQPRVAPTLIALTPVLVLCSSLAVANARISRARHFAIFAVGDIFSITLSAGLAILAAVKGLGAWSLVIQQLSLWGVKAVWVQSAARFRPLLVCRPRLARDLLVFGLNNVGANVADFLGRSAPALVIGAVIGVIAVGKYAIAYQLIRAPELVLSGPLFLATFTAVAGLAETRGPQAEVALRALRMTATVLAPVFCGLALVADLVIELLLGWRWEGAAPVLAALAPGGFLLCLYSVAGAVLIGLGRADLQFRLSLAGGLAMLAGVAVGARFGLSAAAAGVTLGAALVLPLYLVVVARQLDVGHKGLAGFVSPLFAVAVMALVVAAARYETAAAGRWVELAACVVAGAAAFILVLAATSARRLLDDLRRTLPPRPRPETI